MEPPVTIAFRSLDKYLLLTRVALVERREKVKLGQFLIQAVHERERAPQAPVDQLHRCSDQLPNQKRKEASGYETNAMFVVLVDEPEQIVSCPAIGQGVAYAVDCTGVSNRRHFADTFLGTEVCILQDVYRPWKKAVLFLKSIGVIS